MLVELSYFKGTGKWYTDGSYTTRLNALYEIHDEVRALRDRGELPGLQPGTREFVVLINVPDHPFNVPRLIIPEEVRRAFVD